MAQGKRDPDPYEMLREVFGRTQTLTHECLRQVIFRGAQRVGMSGGAWLGGIYLRDGGGYGIVLESLAHYRRRLCTIGQSPEVGGAGAMFASLLGGQAARTVPEIDAAVGRIHAFLGDAGLGGALREDVPLLGRALACYESDICRAMDTGHAYFVGLVGDSGEAAGRLGAIRDARRQIAVFEGQGS